MFIKASEVNRILTDNKNKRMAPLLKMEELVESIRIFFNMQKRWYIIHASINHNGYENRTVIKVNENGEIVYFSCSCPYCFSHSACAHVGMLALYFSSHEVYDGFEYHNNLEEVRQRQFLQLQRRREIELLNKRMDDTNMFINQLKNEHLRDMYDHIVEQNYYITTQVNIDAIHDRFYHQYLLTLDYKVGNEKKYVIKNIGDFLEHIENKDNVKYGKNLEFIHTLKAFDDNSQEVISFMKKQADVFYQTHFIKPTRNLSVSTEDFDEFFDCYSRMPKEFCSLDFYEQEYVVKLKLTDQKDYFILSLNEFFEEKKIILSTKHLYQFTDTSMTRLILDEYGKCALLLKKLNEEDLLIKKEDFQSFYKYVLSDIEEYISISNHEVLSMLEQEEGISLYGDVDDDDAIVFQLEYYYSDYMCYGFDPDNRNISKTADMIEAFIQHYATDIIDDKIYFDDEEKLYAFMKEGLPYLSSYCQIFVSEALNQIGTSHSTSINVGVSIENNLLEIEVDSLDINQDEIYQVLASLRKKRKFHRLKNGKLIYLDSPELNELNELTNTLHLSSSDFENGKIEMPMYRLFECEAFSKENQALNYDRKESVTEFLNKFSHADIHFDIPENYDHILRDYQKDGYQWLKLIAYYGFGGILADDMGLGKTLQMIAYLDSERKAERTNIVITPASLLLNWEDEIHKFSQELKCLPIYGSKNERNELIKQIDDYDVVITSYDYIRRDIDLYENKHFYTIVLDEAQYIKNQKTKNAICVKKLKGEHRFALTGTPIENSLAELWSIFDFLMPHYLYNYSYFAAHYEKPIVKFQDEKRQSRLQNMTSPFLLRRNKAVVLKELPPKIEKTLTFTFNEHEKNLYYANLVQINKELAKKLKIETNQRFEILAMLTKLRQLCLDPRLVYEDEEEPSSKIKGCVELLHSLKDNHKKVLLFSSFTSVLDLLAQKLKEEHISYYMLTGQNTKEERQKLVSQFQNDHTDVFLISLKAGGTGLNLTAAEAVIHFDPWWNMSAQNQATDRAYRIGQNKSVQVFSLIMKDSIEEKIQKLQELKKNLADTFIEDGKSTIQNMSMDEILSLFDE